MKNHPFALCRISSFGFLTVDEIAKTNRRKTNNPMRIEDCIQYCMEQGMQEGHLYQYRQQLQKKVHEQLNRGYQGESAWYWWGMWSGGRHSTLSMRCWRTRTGERLHTSQQGIV